MYDNEYFVVDMAACTSTGEIINNLSLALETLNHSGKKIVLKLNDSYLNQSQMLSIQSLITSWGCILDTVETLNPDTWKTAENMNIYVQKPLEKRFEENNEQAPEPSSTQQDDGTIAIKDVNGLHFEADLDAIKEQQENINIDNDLQRIGISPRANFEDIEKQIISKYNIPSEAPSEQPQEEYQEQNHEDFAQPSEEIKKEIDEIINKNSAFVTDETEVKNSIGVYKKAYDENTIDTEWEDVDFYESPTTDPVISDSKSTIYINQTLRSGQTIESDGNVVIIGDCHPGSEVRAVGDITVWGVLSGIAHAGIKGNVNARIRALKMNAVQLRIANCYSRRPDTTNIPYIIRSSIFTPEEARMVDDDIVLYKINQN